MVMYIIRNSHLNVKTRFKNLHKELCGRLVF